MRYLPVRKSINLCIISLRSLAILALLAHALMLGLISCKPAQQKPVTETEQPAPAPSASSTTARDFGPTLLKIGTQYSIFYHEDHNSLLASRYGFVDLKGKVVIEPKWEEVWDFSEGIALVKRDEKWGWVDKSGAVIEPFLRDVPIFYEGLIRLERAGKWGFIDTKGTVVVQPEWDEVGPFFRWICRSKTKREMGRH